MSNIFTPPGTSARNNEINRQSGAENQLAGLLPGAVGYETQLQNFQSSQLPNMEQGVQNDYYNTTQGGRNAQTQAYGQQQNAAANSAAGAAQSRFAGNPSLAQGAGLDASNQANTNTGNYSAGLNSAAGENNAWMNYMNASSALSPNYQGVDALTSTINGQPATPVGQGLGSFLGSALGSWAGGGFPSIAGALGSLFGGGSGSASVPNASPTQGGLTL